MKKTITTSLLILLALAFAGCDNNNDNPVVSNPPPQPPQGVFSITRDAGVELWWAGPYASNITSYKVYRATSADSIAPANYTFQFSVDADANPDLNLIYYHVTDDAVSNGVTYWYAISSVDRSGRESDLSAEDVWDTPRPEGVNVMYGIYDYGDSTQVDLAGYNFAGESRVTAFGSLCDVYVDNYQGVFYLNAGDIYSTRGTEIQDMGYTGDWDVIGYAPTTGWSELGYAELILNHTYVIRTDDLHYVKMRAIEVNTDGFVRFQWAYQTDQNNPELTPESGTTTIAVTDSPRIAKTSSVSSK